MEKLTGDRAYYKLKRTLESVIDGLGVEEMLELVETVRKESLVGKQANSNERETRLNMGLTQDEINTVWAALEGEHEGYEEQATEEQKEVFKNLYKRFSLLETVCGSPIVEVTRDGK